MTKATVRYGSKRRSRFIAQASGRRKRGSCPKRKASEASGSGLGFRQPALNARETHPIERGFSNRDERVPVPPGLGRRPLRRPKYQSPADPRLHPAVPPQDLRPVQSPWRDIRGVRVTGEAFCGWRDRFRESISSPEWSAGAPECRSAPSSIRSLSPPAESVEAWVASVRAYCVAAVRVPAGCGAAGWPPLSLHCGARASPTAALRADRAAIANWDAISDKNDRGRRGTGTARETNTPAQYPGRCADWKGESQTNHSCRKTVPRPPVCELR